MMWGGLVPPVDSMTGLEAFLAKECGDRGANNLLNARNTWVRGLSNGADFDEQRITTGALFPLE